MRNRNAYHFHHFLPNAAAILDQADQLQEAAEEHERHTGEHCPVSPILEEELFKLQLKESGTTTFSEADADQASELLYMLSHAICHDDQSPLKVFDISSSAQLYEMAANGELAAFNGSELASIAAEIDEGTFYIHLGNTGMYLSDDQSQLIGFYCELSWISHTFALWFVTRNGTINYNSMTTAGELFSQERIIEFIIEMGETTTLPDLLCDRLGAIVTCPEQTWVKSQGWAEIIDPAFRLAVASIISIHDDILKNGDK